MPGRLLAAVVAATALALVPSTASAWAPADRATIHPGVMTFTEGSGQCTANFIYTSGADVLIGQAAHCASTGAATDTNGCKTGTLPLGTRVKINGATRPGTIVYSSWVAMRRAGETDPNACDYNDLALVRIDPADVGRVNPSVPGFGGPAGIGGPSSPGDDVFAYGNSSLRGGITVLKPKQGKVVRTTGAGWSRDVYTVTPGILGDSGSGFLDARGAAIGTLSTVAVAPVPASNGVADLGRELNYAATHGYSAQLANGTEPFRPNLIGAILGAR